MSGDKVMRIALWASVPYNLGAAVVVAFPTSALSQLEGFPVRVHPIYGALLAGFAILFAGAYAWLAVQPIITRPLVFMSTVGTEMVFSTVALFCWLGSVSWHLVFATSGDLLFGCIFFGWLFWGRPVT